MQELDKFPARLVAPDGTLIGDKLRVIVHDGQMYAFSKDGKLQARADASDVIGATRAQRYAGIVTPAGTYQQTQGQGCGCGSQIRRLSVEKLLATI